MLICYELILFLKVETRGVKLILTQGPHTQQLDLTRVRTLSEMLTNKTEKTLLTRENYIYCCNTKGARANGLWKGDQNQV